MTKERFEEITLDKDDIISIIAEHFKVDEDCVDIKIEDSSDEWGTSFSVECKIKKECD